MSTIRRATTSHLPHSVLPISFNMNEAVETVIRESRSPTRRLQVQFKHHLSPVYDSQLSIITLSQLIIMIYRLHFNYAN